MTYDPGIHHRRSVRLKGYDYSRSGTYFITICIQDKLCLFGHIEKNEMILNDAGIMVDQWWVELKNKYKNIELHIRSIMPNHFHGIIKILHKNQSKSVGADLSVRPDNDLRNPPESGSHPHEPKGLLGTAENDVGSDNFGLFTPGQTRRSAPTDHDFHDESRASLSEMVQWFKTMSTNEYIRHVKSDGWPRFNGRLWQRNYHEHIIRDGKAYDQIAYYVKTNPSQWKDDTYYV